MVVYDNFKSFQVLETLRCPNIWIFPTCVCVVSPLELYGTHSLNIGDIIRELLNCSCNMNTTYRVSGSGYSRVYDSNACSPSLSNKKNISFNRNELFTFLVVFLILCVFVYIKLFHKTFQFLTFYKQLCK